MDRIFGRSFGAPVSDNLLTTKARRNIKGLPQRLNGLLCFEFLFPIENWQLEIVN